MNCPVQIKVINKLNTPFYVDWSKSALIFDGLTFAYWKDESTINATISGYDIAWSDRVSTNSGSIQGSIFRNEKVSFIPPNSSITKFFNYSRAAYCAL
ncbi:MAG: hypothetical protein IPJ20_10995 [Flammeovirgaceae bacterium]|nr:hypothetical protein [Flammeovirgaceae bacterium]